MSVAQPAGNIAEFFAPDGALAAALDGYEQRVEQRDLAVAVAAAMAGGDNLVAEAGTGTGKTLAYLAPAIDSGLKVVVSTDTKNLQQQLLHKDLPLLQKALGRDLDVVVMKGRANYLCEARFDKAASQLVLIGDQRRLLESVGAWRQKTQTGDRAELEHLPDQSPLWRDLSVTSEQCTGRQCEHYERCWVTRVRQRAQQCQLIVVNHHLYFADAAMRMEVEGMGRFDELRTGILPPHDMVIFDEAHQLDEIAAQHFGYSVSHRRITELGRDVARAASKQDKLGGHLSRLLGELDLRARQMFDVLPGGHGRTRLLAIPNKVRDRYGRLDEVFERLEARLADFAGEDGQGLRRRASQMAAELAFALRQKARASTVALVELVQRQRDPLDQRPDPTDRDDEEKVPFVRFVENSGGHRAVVARPLDVSSLMRRALANVPAIFTSATLAIDGDFTHFKEKLGVREAAEFVASSPFDYATQACLYVPADLPPPNAPDFSDRCAERASALIEAAGGGAFLLCTSNRMVELMRNALRTSKFAILSQGSAPRGHLIERFIKDGNAVLVATMSFWRGVDVPGRALRLVIIDKLPFSAPGDPVVAARLEYLEKTGVSPFGSYQLPQAALLLRQGFGRLIRTRNDRGMVAILDSRIHTKSYGKTFLRCLPPCPRLTQLADAKNYLEVLM